MPTRAPAERDRRGGRVHPFGVRRQPHPAPAGEGQGLVPVHAGDRMFGLPLRIVAAVPEPRTGNTGSIDQLGQRRQDLGFPQIELSITPGVDERLKASIRDRAAIQKERLHVVNGLDDLRVVVVQRRFVPRQDAFHHAGRAAQDQRRVGLEFLACDRALLRREFFGDLRA
ncbi:MAG: hypothetical protein QM811_01585 [Pirellulales bacterium]